MPTERGESKGQSYSLGGDPIPDRPYSPARLGRLTWHKGVQPLAPRKVWLDGFITGAVIGASVGAVLLTMLPKLL